MASQQTSFKDVFEYPETGKSVNPLKLSNSKTFVRDKELKNENFYSIVQKAKHVALFAQTLKQKIAQNLALSNDTLKQNQLHFLQNQSKTQKLETYFRHDNRIIFGFEAIFGVSLLIYCWNCTFEIIFGQTQHQQPINIVTFAIYLIHIFLFNVTELKNKKQELISDRKEIINYYIRQKALKDTIFLVSILLTLIEFGQSLKGLFIIFRIISLVCYSQSNQTFMKLQNQIQVSIQTQSVISMVKLVYKILIFLHFVSILLNLIAIIEMAHGFHTTWLTSERNNLEYDSNFQKYIIGWYWSATILSTVGFGQIVPANNLQRFLVSIIQIICCMTFGYFVNLIGSLIKLRNQPEQKYQKQLRSLNRCLNNMNPTNELKHKIRNHYFNMHVIESIHNPNEESQMLGHLSTQIKNGLIEQNNIGFLQKCQIMCKFNHETLLNLTHKLKKIILAPETILYSRNRKEFKLWFIKNGTVEEYTDSFADSKLKKVISVYNEKDPVVGFTNFFTQNIYKTMAKTKGFTLLYELQQANFIEVIKDNIKEYYKFLTIKQTYLQKKKKYTNKCLSCDRYTHNAINCPRIHYVRKDVKKLANKRKDLTNYLLEQNKKKKKADRSLVRLNWKVDFGCGDFQHDIQCRLSNESSLKNTQNGQGMQNLFKSVKRETVNEIKSRPKNSFSLSKKNSSSKHLQLKEIVANYQSFKQLVSEDDVSVDEPFDKILLKDQTKEYMPAHNIDEVLLAYNKKCQKKFMKEEKLKHFKFAIEKSQ